MRDPELVTQATARWFAKLSEKAPICPVVASPRRAVLPTTTGLCSCPAGTRAEKKAPPTTGEGRALIHRLAVDPVLRGLIESLQARHTGWDLNKITSTRWPTVADKVADTVEQVEAGKPVTFSWNHVMLKGGASAEIMETICAAASNQPED